MSLCEERHQSRAPSLCLSLPILVCLSLFLSVCQSLCLSCFSISVFLSVSLSLPVPVSLSVSLTLSHSLAAEQETSPCEAMATYNPGESLSRSHLDLDLGLLVSRPLLCQSLVSGALWWPPLGAWEFNTRLELDQLVLPHVCLLGHWSPSHGGTGSIASSFPLPSMH